MVLQHMAGGLVCHPVKDDISMIEDNSGYSFAPRHMFRGVASTESSPPLRPYFTMDFQSLEKCKLSKCCKTKYGS